MECLDADGLVAMFGGPPSADVEAHLDGCERCRELCAAYARVVDESETDTEIDTPYAPTVASERPPSASRHGAVGDLVGQRYELRRIVGEGGMGVVWAARDLRGGRDVALKMLKIDTAELTQRARREAQVAAAIGHPNVIEVHDVVAVPGAPPILVMPLLEGESLDRAIARRRTLPIAEVVALLLPLVSAVRAAHARGVLHRDLKPQNIFLAQAGDTGAPVVMLLDFGLAKLIGQDVETLTRTGAIVGTPHYMAPEQLYGERDIDRRADVWAIGAVAYECLTGKRPLEGGSYAQLVRAATRRTQRPLAILLPEAPALADLIDRMLSHDRGDRPELSAAHAALDAMARGA